MYSLLEASCKPKDLAKYAAEYKMPAIALTDAGNMFGAIEFYNYCQAQGVKPILGLDAYLAPGSRLVKGEERDQGPNRRLVLLAMNFEGYQNLCQISSIGYQEGFYYKPRIDYDVLRKHNKNIIALSGGLMGEIPYTFLHHGRDKAMERIRELKEIFQDRFYLEICRPGVSDYAKVNDFLLEAARIENLPIVASNDVHYLKQEDQLAQEVLVCIGTNKALADESRFKLGSDQFYLKSAEKMQDAFKDLPEAIANTLVIADRCDVKFNLKDEKGNRIYHLPNYPTSQGRTLKEEIEELSRKGLEERFEEMVGRGEARDEERKKVYYDRLAFELSVIDKMGFNGYFLIVQDFILWAKNNSCPVGPGRGSGAGSLVAYSLKITDLDPMPYNLIFERFLNPERISMPDFDIDFCQDKRQSVIEYVTNKYGQDSVAQIITFGKLQARAAIRDVGRVLGMSMQEVTQVIDLIPDKLGISLQQAIDDEARLKEWMENDPKINTLIELSLKIEGLTRHASIHAAGVIISNRPLVEYAPLYKGSANETVVQYDMKNAEGIGLIKFDFLGLKTLTHLEDALSLIEKNRNKVHKLKDISLSDPGIYEIFCAGDTDGIFQFEGGGITEFTKRVKPTNFEDITAINALYRPGPMQFLDEYKGRKHGEIQVKYIFPELEDILKETYGIIVYQEHVQLIAARIASYSLGEADILRRAMGKKDPKEMAKQKDRFLSGAKDNGFDELKASELFDQMAKFAEYGFNKSHAAAYCVVAAHTAWLKRYYPVEFYAALCTTEMSNTDKIVQYIKDARDHNIEVRAPHVNFSERKFSVHEDTIFFGLAAIKGVGEAAVDQIVEARSHKPDKIFKDLEDFFSSVDRKVNKKVIECLIKAGALDGFGANRAQLMLSYGRFLDRADSKRKDDDVGQVSLFSLDPQQEEKIELPDVSDWTKTLRLAAEKEVLGFYLSDHPLSGIEKMLKPYISHQIGKLEGLKNKQKVCVGGLLSMFKEFITKKGTRMAFSEIEDLSGKIEFITFPDVYAESEMLFKQDGPILVSGTYESDEKGNKIIAEKIVTLNDRMKTAKVLEIQLTDKMLTHLESIKDVLGKNPGPTQVRFKITYPELKRVARLELEDNVGIQTSPDFMDQMETIMGSLESLELQ
jgi:DNA polymerase-3 subunit alpha